MLKICRVITIIILLLLCLFVFQANADLTYWLPYISTFEGPNGYANRLSGYSNENDNLVQIDFDSDDIFDQEVILDAGEPLLLDFAPEPGLRIVSTYPMQLVYRYRLSDQNAYEDGSFQYEVICQRRAGKTYRVPTFGNQTTIMAIDDETDILVDSNNNGSVDENFTLNKGEQRIFNVAPGALIRGDKPFYGVVVNISKTGYGHSYAYALLPVNLLGKNYMIPDQHPYSHLEAVDFSGVHLVSAEDGNTIIAGTTTKILDEGDVWFISRNVELVIKSTGPVFGVYLSKTDGLDPWKEITRSYDYAFPLVPEGFGVRKFYTFSRNPEPAGEPWNQLFVASYSDNNEINFECLDEGNKETITLDKGEIFHLQEPDDFMDCWRGEMMVVTSSQPVQAGLSERGWWNLLTEATNAHSYFAQSCSCDTDADCDDGLFCNGQESCENNCLCVMSEPPCLDDEVCDEIQDKCLDYPDDVDDDDDEDIGEGGSSWPTGEISGGCCGCGF